MPFLLTFYIMIDMNVVCAHAHMVPHNATAFIFARTTSQEKRYSERFSDSNWMIVSWYHYPLNIITGIMTTFKIPYRAEIQTLITNPVSSKVSRENWPETCTPHHQHTLTCPPDHMEPDSQATDACQALKTDVNTENAAGLRVCYSEPRAMNQIAHVILCLEDGVSACCYRLLCYDFT
ncbi:hypothetical protein F2P81_021946 [Scophthalmus maximus]|uniref:Uncharacterized protein n=1 Tax=Scophthalmus maximus TaxID=52904 RepID=A0A6A4RYD6_SCOMX|nr:hypothetical protein F2P81_021946 [Scophthalmus maximus]